MSTANDMQVWLIRLFLAVCLLHGSAMADTIDMIVPNDVMQDYQEFVSGRDVRTITRFDGKKSRRDVVELVLIQQALSLGGMHATVRFAAADSWLRIQKEVAEGRILMAANSGWKADLESIKDRLFLSLPCIEDGEFEVGLYVLPTNQKALSAKNLTDVRQLSAISNRAWMVDWALLEKLGPARLENAVKWETMVRMVAGGRVDFLLAPFQPEADLSLTVDNTRLIPIPNLKLGLHGTRHFIVSRQHPQGQATINALNRGLLLLKQQQVLKQAYQQSGFFNAQVGHWQRLN